MTKLCRLLPMAVVTAMIVLSACGRSQRHFDRVLAEVERGIEAGRVDSALNLLDEIDVADLRHDSLRAKYAYLQAQAHLMLDRSMILSSSRRTHYVVQKQNICFARVMNMPPGMTRRLY